MNTNYLLIIFSSLSFCSMVSASELFNLTDTEKNELRTILKSRPKTPEEPTKPEGFDNKFKSMQHGINKHNYLVTLNQHKIEKDLYPYLRKQYEEKLNNWLTSENREERLRYAQSQTNCNAPSILQ